MQLTLLQGAEPGYEAVNTEFNVTLKSPTAYQGSVLIASGGDVVSLSMDQAYRIMTFLDLAFTEAQERYDYPTFLTPAEPPCHSDW